MAFADSGHRPSNADLGDDGMENLPSSSRVKKVLIWNSKHREFEMPEEDKKELRESHFDDSDLWQKFEQ